MTISVFIDGGVGTTGIQIVERLEGLPELSLLTLPEAQRKDAGARRAALNDADIVILCLPDDAAREAVALLDNDRTRVIDASTAHRVAPDWVYGFPEVVGHSAVGGARFVSNPGCYSTGFIALVAPLVRAGLLPADIALTCNAVSGYSGGGKAMIADYEGSSGAPSAWRGYALGLTHKHVPEMRVQSGLVTPPLFTPAVVPLYSGMVVQIPLQLATLPGTVTLDDLRGSLGDFYAGSPIVSVAPAPADGLILVERLADTDRMELFVLGNAATGQALLVATLDNLGKGASGAAVQNLNILAGLPETAGLRL
jgi:N-acetyl-gamma-glutamyl-phosphate reductase